MFLKRLTLDTTYFDDYLGFFTEVLELELSKLTDESMQLDLKGTILEIRVGKEAASAFEIEFSFTRDEYAAMIQKINFYYYRKGPTRFLLQECDNIKCTLIDPDGRLWRFSQSALTQTHFLSEAHS